MAEEFFVQAERSFPVAQERAFYGSTHAADVLAGEATVINDDSQLVIATSGPFTLHLLSFSFLPYIDMSGSRRDTTASIPPRADNFSTQHRASLILAYFVQFIFFPRRVQGTK